MLEVNVAFAVRKKASVTFVGNCWTGTFVCMSCVCFVFGIDIFRCFVRRFNDARSNPQEVQELLHDYDVVVELCESIGDQALEATQHKNRGVVLKERKNKSWFGCCCGCCHCLPLLLLFFRFVLVLCIHQQVLNIAKTIHLNTIKS